MNWNFKIGDRVLVNGSIDGTTFKNEKGAIIAFESGIPPIGIKFDRNIRGHDCDGRVKDGYGYYVYKKNLTKDTIREEVIYD